MSDKRVTYQILTEIAASSEEEAILLAHTVLENPRSVKWVIYLKNLPRNILVHDD